MVQQRVPARFVRKYNTYEEVKSFKHPLEISYQIESLISGERLKYLKTAILREPEIRLFNCDLKIECYEKPSMLKRSVNYSKLGYLFKQQGSQKIKPCLICS